MTQVTDLKGGWAKALLRATCASCGLLTGLSLLSCSEDGGAINTQEVAEAGQDAPVDDPSAAHYPSERILRYDIAIDPSTWAALLADPLCTGSAPCGGEYVRATLRFENRTFPDVGLRFKGNSSLTHVADLKPTEAGYGRYSFKLKLDKFVKDQELDGLQTLNLNNEYLDPSLLREVLAYETFRKAGVVAGRTAFVELYLNDEYYGLYVSVEEVESPFLKRNFKGGGNLYKPTYGDLVFRGTQISDYGGSVTSGPNKPAVEFTGEEAYEKQNNESKADYGDLLSFIDVLNNTPDSELESKLGAVFDIDAFTTFLAVNTLVTALDYYGGGLPQNYFLYNNPSTGKFVYLPWDLNNAFGTFSCFQYTAEQVVALPVDSPYCLNTPNAMAEGKLIGPTDRPLIGRLLANPTIQAAYRAKLGNLLQTVFDPAQLQARIDSLAALIRPSVDKDPHKFYTLEEFDKNLSDRVAQAPGLKTFVEQRAQAVGQCLTQECADAGVVEAGPPGDGAPSCGTCEKYLASASRCVATCVQGCTCPATSPEGTPLVCDQQLGICHP